MKINSIVSEISFEELVNFLSTATYGDNIFSTRLNNNENFEFPDTVKCLEEQWAYALLGGGSIMVIDNEELEEKPHSLAPVVPAQGVDFYGNMSKSTWFGNYYAPVYTVNLKRILTAFSEILSDECTGKYTKCLKQNFNNIFVNDNGDFYDAWNIYQYIIFGDVVYG